MEKFIISLVAQIVIALSVVIIWEKPFDIFWKDFTIFMVLWVGGFALYKFSLGM